MDEGTTFIKLVDNEFRRRTDSTVWNSKVRYTLERAQGDVSDVSSMFASMRQSMSSFKVSNSQEQMSAFQISDLNDINYDLKMPIQCVLYRTVDDDSYFVESIELGVYGLGESPTEAVEDVKQAVVVLYESLKDEDESNLSSQMQVKKRLLSRIIG